MVFDFTSLIAGLKASAGTGGINVVAGMLSLSPLIIAIGLAALLGWWFNRGRFVGTTAGFFIKSIIIFTLLWFM